MPARVHARARNPRLLARSGKERQRGPTRACAGVTEAIPTLCSPPQLEPRRAPERVQRTGRRTSRPDIEPRGALPRWLAGRSPSLPRLSSLHRVCVCVCVRVRFRSRCLSLPLAPPEAETTFSVRSPPQARATLEICVRSGGVREGLWGGRLSTYYSGEVRSSDGAGGGELGAYCGARALSSSVIIVTVSGRPCTQRHVRRHAAPV